MVSLFSYFPILLRINICNSCYSFLKYLYAAMAELADALDLGSSGATRTGSIPASCTKGY